MGEAADQFQLLPKPTRRAAGGTADGHVPHRDAALPVPAKPQRLAYPVHAHGRHLLEPGAWAFGGAGLSGHPGLPRGHPLHHRLPDVEVSDLASVGRRPRGAGEVQVPLRPLPPRALLLRSAAFRTQHGGGLDPCRFGGRARPAGGHHGRGDLHETDGTEPTLALAQRCCRLSRRGTHRVGFRFESCLFSVLC